ncbi:MAG: hypothetical protein MK207_01390 [Saprospiraceae bacterium]|nr:hypothetical protein [Saprospiraceae bacterium]
MQIIGTVKYQNISGGFWGIVDTDGNRWKPVKMPKELQKEDLSVQLKAKKSDGIISIFMWGTTIDILEFNIID